MKFGCSVASLAFIVACAAGCNKTEKSAVANPAPAALTPSSAVSSPGTPPAAIATIDEEAIKSAIGRHLRDNAGINLAAMDMSFDSVSIQGDKAQANVTFRLKQGGTTMQMVYSLSRHANDWLVLHSEPGGGQFSHPPMDKAHSGASGSPQSPGTPDLKRFYKHGTSQSSANPPATSPPQN